MSQSVTAAAAKGDNNLEPVVPVSDVARRALDSAAQATRQVGWISFWVQLSLSIVSAIILLFSVAFTSQVHAFRRKDTGLWGQMSALQT